MNDDLFENDLMEQDSPPTAEKLSSRVSWQSELDKIQLLCTSSSQVGRLNQHSKKDYPAMRILALDLAKYKTVACEYEAESGRHRQRA